MTKEEKQQLLIELCARLPYGIKCKLSADGVSLVDDLQLAGLSQFLYGRLDVVPYLRPMSSMTNEEKGEYMLCISMTKVRKGDALTLSSAVLIDWLYTHHLDFRGLIHKGLALEAPKDMYKTESL